MNNTLASQKAALAAQTSLSRDDIQRKIRQADYMAKYDLRAFVKRAFHILDAGTPLSWNWHLDLLCWEATRAVALWLPQTALDIAHITKEDHQRRLIVNIPPRSMKSIIFSVCLKAWVLGHNPSFRSIGASYSAALAKGFNRDILLIINSDWYKRIFPDVSMSKISEPEMETTLNGKLNATSTGGRATGLGGNLNTADDLLDPEKAFSDADRIFSNRWMTGTFASRTNDKKNATIIIVMQRLHEDDTTGHILETDRSLPNDHPKKWRLVKIPSIFEEDQTFHYYNQTKHVKAGDILHPDRQDKEDLEGELATMGDLKFAGQYLQEPAPLDGGVLAPSQLQYYRNIPKKPEDYEGTWRIVQSWDTAIKVLAHHDFSVCTTWLENEDGFFLLDMFRDKLEYTPLKEMVKFKAEQFKPNIILVEDKGSGQQILQDLQAETVLPMVGIKPHTDKVTRAMGIAPYLKAGKIFVKCHPEHEDLPPKNAPWYQALVSEMSKFPNSRHDDIIDSISQAINWMRDNSIAVPRILAL